MYKFKLSPLQKFLGVLLPLLFGFFIYYVFFQQDKEKPVNNIDASPNTSESASVVEVPNDPSMPESTTGTIITEDIYENLDLETLKQIGPSIYTYVDPTASDYEKITKQIGSVDKIDWTNDRFTLLYTRDFNDESEKGEVFELSYYTKAIGLGENNTDVKVNRNLCVLAYEQNLETGFANAEIGALNNFWRGIENLSVTPDWTSQTGGYYQGADVHSMVWATSQAAPMRKMFIDGNLGLNIGLNPNTGDMAFASGGFISDTEAAYMWMFGQQQYALKHNKFESLSNEIIWHQDGTFPSSAVWNHIDINNDIPHLIEEYINAYSIALIKENNILIPSNPYLYVDDKTKELILRAPDVPSTVVEGPRPVLGTNYSSEDFVFIYGQNVDVEDINNHIDNGKHIVFAGSIFYLNKTIRVNQENCVILGLGMTTLVPMFEGTVLDVSAPGCRLCNLLVQAAPLTSDPIDGSGVNLINIEGTGRKDAPVYLYDIFVRVGGPKLYETTDTIPVDNMMHIKMDYVYGENIWLWRADHDEETYLGGIGQDTCICDHGLTVESDHVHFSGLAVEHTLKEQVIWNGDDGSVYMYQSEYPYDVDGEWNYSNFIIGEDVTSFHGVGMGMYFYFSVGYYATKQDHDNDVHDEWKFSTDGPIVDKPAIAYDTTQDGISLCNIFVVALNGPLQRPNVGIQHITSSDTDTNNSVISKSELIESGDAQVQFSYNNTICSNNDIETNINTESNKN